jgi:peptidoglycan/LPS O-acetylase OafA/YrhL
MPNVRVPPPDLAHYRQDIDGLRGIAVLLVVAFHALPTWLPGGFIGVDIFFVISGYLITKIILEQINAQTFSIANFYSRRICRILPALLLVLATTYLASYFLLLRDEFQHLSLHTLGASLFASNFLLWNESGYFDTAAEIKPLLHLWSLSIEEQFYILWPALLLMAKKLRQKTWLLTIVLLVCSLLWGIFVQSKDPVAGFYAPQARIWELLIGALLAHLNLRATTLQTKGAVWPIREYLCNTSAVLGATLIALSAMMLNSRSAFPGALALVPVLGAAALIIGHQSIPWVNKRLLSARYLVWFGKISFPLYLWHWPLLCFARILENQTPPLSIRILLVGVSIILAWATWKWIETPVRFGPHPKAKTGVLAALLCSLGVVAYWNTPPRTVIPIERAGPVIPQVNANESAATAPAVPHLESKGQSVAIAPKPSIEMPKTVQTTSITTPSAAAKLIKYEQKLISNPDYITELAVSRQKAIRANRCHLHKYAQPFEQYAQGLPLCLSVDLSKKNILILGDSHAADLYAALASANPVGINYLQATGAGCTPIKSMYSDVNDGCLKLYEYTLNFLRENKVNTVILAARWPTSFTDMLADIDSIKALGIQVVLAGPAHEYREDAHKLIARRDKTMDYEVYLATFLDSEKFALNKKMAEFATQQKKLYRPHRHILRCKT